MSEQSAKQDKMIKSMDRAEWDRCAAHAKARNESMASFATRAFRQMRELDVLKPIYSPPAERQAGQPSAVGQPSRQPSGAALPVPLMIESVGELAALMHGAAAMATAAGLKLPEAHARDALALARASVGEALRAARGNRPQGVQPEALRLANERRRQAAAARLAQPVGAA
jgi:hypothetical protein